MKQRISLESAAAKVCCDASKPPLIFQLPPRQGRRILEEIQSTPIVQYPAVINTMTVKTDWGAVKVYCVVPENRTDYSGIIFYIHGAGWVFGSFHTHEKLVRELACRTNCVVIFPEYSRAPEARYPIALEQCYQIMCTIPELLQHTQINNYTNRLIVAGDSVGGNMATVMTLLSKYRNGPHICKQLMYYPVTNACFCTPSYLQFAENYSLYRAGMQWFWNQYAPCPQSRLEITASPLLASLSQLHGLPEAMIINGEADVLRDEGEAYARRLRCAGVPVTAIRCQGIIHDFVMLHALDQTQACRIAMDASTAWINCTSK